MIKKKMIFYQQSDISNQTSAKSKKADSGKLKTESYSQKGFAPILVLLLLVAGIGLGAYLIQQQTNLSPRAEYTSADGGECRDNPRLAPLPNENFMSPADRKDYDYYWKADCSRTCVDFNNSTDCPASDLGGTKTRWCYGFKDAGYCLRLQVVKAGTSEDVSNTDRFRESTGKKPTQVAAGGASGGGNINACTAAETQQIANTYYDAKVAQRYARYTAIMNGVAEWCVQADLGVEIAGVPGGLKETSTDGTNGRLYLCSGAKNSKEKLDLVWKSVSDDGKIHPATRSNPTSVEDVNKVMGGYICAAKDKLDITPKCT